MNKQAKILITGGHLTPAVAVISELRKRGFSNFVWVGHKFNQAGTRQPSAEFQTVTMLNIPFLELRTGKLIRNWGLDTLLYGLKQFLLIFWGFGRSFFIILTQRPRLILSFGGYLAVPIVIFGKLSGAKVITHEQTIVAGLANRIIAKFADKVLISWESSKSFFDPKKTILTGNPIRREIFTVKSESLTKNFRKDLPILLIYGGNQGSHEINFRIFHILNKLLEEVNIIHQTGNSSVFNDFQNATQLRNALPIQLKNRYIVRDYILTNEVGEALNKSDLIFSRSGANSVSEYLALGKPSVLMPLPNTSHNEALKNAELVKSTGLGYIIEQKNSLTPETVYQSILLAINQIKSQRGFNGQDLESCKESARKLIDLDAPMNVVNEIEKAML